MKEITGFFKRHQLPWKVETLEADLPRVPQKCLGNVKEQETRRRNAAFQDLVQPPNVAKSPIIWFSFRENTACPIDKDVDSIRELAIYPNVFNWGAEKSLSSKGRTK